MKAKITLHIYAKTTKASMAKNGHSKTDKKPTLNQKYQCYQLHKKSFKNMQTIQSV